MESDDELEWDDVDHTGGDIEVMLDGAESVLIDYCCCML
jgi:hypothetical protein